MTLITRRSAIGGAVAALTGVGLSVAAIPQTPASEHGSVPEALLDLMHEYHEAHVASRLAEKAFNAIRETTWRRIGDACISVPDGRGGYVWLGAGYRQVYPSTAKHQFEKNRLECLALCSEDDRAEVRRIMALYRRRLNRGLAKAEAIRLECGLEAATDLDAEARHRAYAAKDALLGYKPTTLEEVAAIVRCLYVAARDSESFYSYPAAQVAIMLNPDLAVAS